MSLFNDIIPEVKELLLVDKEKYPSRHERMMEDLNESILISDLTVKTATALVEYLFYTDKKPELDSFIIKLYAVFGK